MTPLLHLVVKETLGTSFYDLLPPEEREPVKSRIASSRDGLPVQSATGAGGAGGRKGTSGGGWEGSGGGGDAIDGDGDMSEAVDQKPTLTSQKVIVPRSTVDRLMILSFLNLRWIIFNG